MEHKKASSIIYGATILTGVNLFSQILGFAFRIWLSRLVSAEGLGLYQLIMPIYSVVMSLCVSGITVAVSRQTAAYTAVGNHIAVRQLVRKALIAYILCILSASLICIPFSDIISVNFLGDARTRLGLILLFPLMLLTGWENVHKNYFYGVKNVIPPAISEIVEQTTRTAAILGLLLVIKPHFEEQQVGIIVIGMVISEVFSAILLTIFFRSHQKTLPKTGQSLPGISKTISMIALPVAGANVVSNLIGSINSIIIPQRLIVSGLEPSVALSSFGVTFAMTMPLLMFSMAFMVAISLVMLPRISEMLALEKMDEVRKQIKKALQITTVVVVFFTSILIPFGHDIAVSLFKNQNAGAYMIPLAIGTVFVCYEYVLGSFLNALGQQKRAAANLISAAIIQLIVTWIAVARPELRLQGFVIAYIVGNLLGAILNLSDVILTIKKPKQLKN